MKTTMQLKFEGQTHSIEAGTLVSVLTRYQAIVEDANRRLSGGSREVSLRVNAIEKGSFVVDISVVQNVISQLFSKDSVEYAAALSAVVFGVYKLYERFKGKPVKTDADKKEASVVLNYKGDTYNITNVYNSPDVRRSVSSSIETSKEDPNVDGFTVKGEDGGDCVRFERADFDEYIYDDFDKEEAIPDERVVEEVTTLVVVGLNFERGSRWQFMYNGFKIAMTVRDDALMRRIEAGERFGKGDSIKVRLRTQQRYNKDYKAYENKAFKIVEFLEHIQPSREVDAFG